MKKFLLAGKPAVFFYKYINLNIKSLTNDLSNIVAQLSGLEEITYRTMMGEYIIYYRGKIVGGIYDNRLLVKPVKSAISCIPTAPYELPYKGAKKMLLVDEVDDKELLARLYIIRDRFLDSQCHLDSISK